MAMGRGSWSWNPLMRLSMAAIIALIHNLKNRLRRSAAS